MEHTHQHYAHSKQGHPVPAATKEGTMKLAVSATVHCLIGCGIGEVAGMIIATYFGMTSAGSLIISITMGFVFGFALGIVPYVRKGLSVSQSLKIVLIAEGLSITVMEAFEALTQVFIPGVMTATLQDGTFWMGMLASLVAGFIAALPVNYFMIKRGFRHQH
jgi:hypothetical protein